MKKVRVLLSVIVLVLLCAGYGASQIAAFGGPTFSDPEAPINYAKAIDCAPVQWAALFILVICIVFAFIRDSEANEK